MDNLYVSKPLPLEGAKNVRDLGGYPAAGGFTAGGAFLRGDGLHSLTPRDIRALEDYGVRLVIDLRSQMEAERQPDPFTGSGLIKRVHVPMLDRMNSNNFEGPLPSCLFEIYSGLLDESARDIGRVMVLMAGERQGACLFHCTAGKDRTGVLAMLLLDLAGVSGESILADYSMSEVYMEEIFSPQREMMRRLHLPDFLLRSPADQMARTLEFLRENYTGARKYLLCQAGCSPEIVKTLSSRLMPSGR